MSAAAALSSLGAFALVLASMFVVPFALWCNFALARTAQLDARVGSIWLWILAFVVTLGLPIALAVWKYGTDSRRLWPAMMWLPLLWNLGAILLATQVMPALLVESLRAQGDLAGRRFGDSHKVARILSAVGNGLADRLAPPAATGPRASARSDSVTPRPDPTKTGANTSATADPGATRPSDLGGAIAVPFSAAGNAILMDVDLEGPAGRGELP